MPCRSSVKTRMTDLPRYIWIDRDTWAPFAEIAADARKRAEALANAKRCGARRKYLALVQAFAEHDTGVGPREDEAVP